jgi:hypothetical protein
MPDTLEESHLNTVENKGEISLTIGNVTQIPSDYATDYAEVLAFSTDVLDIDLKLLGYVTSGVASVDPNAIHYLGVSSPCECPNQSYQ